ncbi:MAG: hypothetical protein K1X74_17065 [Pirellulales bacterium]|nr:hypothetical protein [Pirellulales bacterium]
MFPARPPRSRGYTLIETVMAAGLIALAIVPAMRMMSDGIEAGWRLDNSNLCATYCVSKLEEHLALGAAYFTEDKASGSFAADGYSTLRFAVTRSQQPADGGIADRLMTVTATVWADTDGDGVKDADETGVTMASKIAKMAVYQSVAGTN